MTMVLSQSFSILTMQQFGMYLNMYPAEGSF